MSATHSSPLPPELRDLSVSKKIGILGGTFDPIHVAHLIGAELVREALALDKIFFVPAADPPHKQGIEKTPALHRRTMVELAIAGNPYFELCSVDLDRPGPHYSTETVGLIRAQSQVSAERCFFIMGGDSLVDLPTWHEPQTLLNLCRLAVIHRPGYEPDLDQLTDQLPGLETRLDWVEMPLIDIAARTIRADHRAGRSIRYRMVDDVWAYIRQHRLYQ